MAMLDDGVAAVAHDEPERQLVRAFPTCPTPVSPAETEALF